MRAVVFFIFLAVIWLLWSGIFKTQILLFGAISCLVVVAVALRVGFVRREIMPFEIGFRILAYLPWLIWEIVKSNFTAARIVLSPSLPIQPQLLRTHASQKTDFGRMLYANSITLTPGTITLDLRDGSLLIHALTPQFAEGVESGEMDRRVARIDAGEPPSGGPSSC
jgi:multicomponent Na+:H+ antiporter subunit E